VARSRPIADILDAARHTPKRYLNCCSLRVQE
jgi:hypothetical protein